MDSNLFLLPMYFCIFHLLLYIYIFFTTFFKVRFEKIWQLVFIWYNTHVYIRIYMLGSLKLITRRGNETTKIEFY